MSDRPATPTGADASIDETIGQALDNPLFQLFQPVLAVQLIAIQYVPKSVASGYQLISER